ncbi:MAG: ribonuclease III [Rickettsiales bacterium]|jgi:ribonuclease III|nr:ribonuclease III [Rickettsiales bacterium]
MFEKLEAILQYKFKNAELLKEALTHPSVLAGESKEKINYERLELLGDSILSCVVTIYLFKTHKNDTEGALSKRRAFLVSKYTIAKIAEQIQLGEYIILSSGEELNNGRKNTNNLENALEAIIGAIFLDSNFRTVQHFILKIWRQLDKKNKNIPLDPKTELQEWTQKYFRELPKYELISANNGEFYMRLLVPGRKVLECSGKSIKMTKNELAKQMLENIRGDITPPGDRSK